MNQFQEEGHVYTMDGVVVPSLTQMLEADGWSEHLASVPRATLESKRDWGTELHRALLLDEYGYNDAYPVEFRQHCLGWTAVCRRMKWAEPPIWKKAETAVYVNQDGFQWAFTPDRASPKAVVELKGTYSPHPSHNIQTALQVIGLGYPRSTPRYCCYFDKDGISKLSLCDPSITVNGIKLDVFAEAERIIFEHARSL